MSRVATYGFLFPKGNTYPLDNVVLALEVSRSGASGDRILVPGTEGKETESSPFLVFEETSDSLYLLWTSQVSGVNQLMLRSYRDGSFGPPIQVAAGSFGTSMGAPQAVVTRDEFSVPSDEGGTAIVHRTVLHLIWWEELTTGNQIRYAPITLIEGVYTGWHSVYALNDFDQSPDDSAAAAEILPQLYRSPRIQTGRTDHSVVVSFGNERNGRLAVLDLSVLPGEIGFIGGKIRAHIIDIGRKKPSAQVIADKIRAHIIDIGRLNPRVVRYLGTEVYNHILTVAPRYEETGDYEWLADEVSTYAILSATSVLENGRLGEPTNAPEILRLAAPDDAGVDATLLQVRQVFTGMAPRTAAAPTMIFASKDGKKTLVAWDATNQIRYKESSTEGWGETLAVPLSAELTREQAYEFLQQRIRR